MVRTRGGKITSTIEDEPEKVMSDKLIPVDEGGGGENPVDEGGRGEEGRENPATERDVAEPTPVDEGGRGEEGRENPATERDVAEPTPVDEGGRGEEGKENPATELDVAEPTPPPIPVAVEVISELMVVEEVSTVNREDEEEEGLEEEVEEKSEGGGQKEKSSTVTEGDKVELNREESEGEEKEKSEEESEDIENSEERSRSTSSEGEEGEKSVDKNDGSEEVSSEKEDGSEEETVSGSEEEEEDNEVPTEAEAIGKDSEEEAIAMQPLRMHFPSSQYNKKIKLSTRCHIFETVTLLLEQLVHPLTEFERGWFENHAQFSHIFHMPRDPNHKHNGMWMLLLRKACLDKEKEVWFIVNGVPIRYGLREHALMSGLNCCSYPLNYKNVGSDVFALRYFEDITKVRLQDVKSKLLEMEPCRSKDRLRMAIVYLLGSILVGQTKMSGENDAPVDTFCLRVVSDLRFCSKFPWGRYSFEHMLKSISHTMTHFGGIVEKEGAIWPVPGFCIPLELLAFEAIPALGNEFIEMVPEADESCPRMCRRRFKKSSLKGFPLAKIYDALGTTKEIASVLTSIDEETSLLKDIMEVGEEEDKHDPVVDSWMKRLRQERTVFFEEMDTDDVGSRSGGNNKIHAIEQPRIDSIELVDLVNSLKEEMRNKLEIISDKVDGLDKRIAPLEAYVKEQEEKAKAQEDVGNEKNKKNQRGVKRTAESSEAAVGIEKNKRKKRGAKK